MKNIITLIGCFILSGCSMFVPVKPPEFPEVPVELKQKCERLKLLQAGNISITDMLKVVVENYSLHYQCSSKVDGWNDWYEQQRKNFNTLK